MYYNQIFKYNEIYDSDNQPMISYDTESSDEEESDYEGLASFNTLREQSD